MGKLSPAPTGAKVWFQRDLEGERMGSLPFAVLLTLLLIVALAIVAASILASAFAPRWPERRSAPPSDSETRK